MTGFDRINREQLASELSRLSALAEQALSGLSDAAICRAMGWDVGTRLIADEGYGPTILSITAIGETSILARSVDIREDWFGRHEYRHRENSWTLACRDWQIYDGPVQP